MSPEDISGLVRLNRLCFPRMAEEDEVWTEKQLRNHLRMFPQGQLVAELDGELVGASASLIVDMGEDPYREHTYAGITDDSTFLNHTSTGDTLYGADVYVHPEHRGRQIGHLLYEARRDLCRRLNLRRILAGGRLSGYHEWADALSPEDYLRKVEQEEIEDPVLSFQLGEGFVVRGLLENYIRDPLSLNYASLIEWLNPDYEAIGPGARKVRVASVQYQMRKVKTFEDFAAQVEYFVETASDYRADFVVFPEFFSVQLLSQEKLSRLPPLEGIERLSRMEEAYVELMQSMATRYGVNIIGGSHPIRREGRLLNSCPIIGTDGEVAWQPKLHITPSERHHWGISGGKNLFVVSTPKARIGVNICYDVEFPEVARYLADEGLEILMVPFCTDDRQAYTRVRNCAMARAIENQIYVVTSGVIGNLPDVPAMDIHYGRASVFSPSDFEFGRDGILGEADSNVETLLVTDLDIDDLYRNRSGGSVNQRRDRRRDLFSFHHSFRRAPDSPE